MKTIYTLLLTLFLAHTGHAADSLKDAFMHGKPHIDIRYRYEFVDQDGLPEKAHASTIRTRLGYTSDTYHHLFGRIELENVAQIGGDDYNDTRNGRTDHPVVADVETTEVNQLLLHYTGIPDTTLTAGRQVLSLDGQRYIGPVAWRQNNQTFDAVTLIHSGISDTTFTYGYIHRINRIFGSYSGAGDWDSDSHFMHISYTRIPWASLTAYGYFLDFENDSPGNSSQTLGVSATGKKVLNETMTFTYHAEYAEQTDYADNPTDYRADYYHLAPALAWKNLTLTVGYEVLGSDSGRKGFATPLATLHKFNGWADKFLNTPANGLEDVYVSIKYTLSGCDKLACLNGLITKVQYHHFAADGAGGDYGREWDLYVKKPLNAHCYIEAEYAYYDADNFDTDTQQLTLGFAITY